MSSSGPHTIMETPAPLVCGHGIVNNALLHSSPTICNHTLPQIINILHFWLVDLLLHYAADFIFNWIKVGLLGDQKSFEMSARVSRSMRLIVSCASCAGALSC